MQNSKVTTIKNGKEIIKDLKVSRTFQDAAGAMIHLFEGGDYGYRDGAPVRTAEEFGIIGDPIHREMALSWFERRGKILADKYYNAMDKARRKKLGDQQNVSPVSDSTLDQVLYFKTPADGPPIDLKTETPASWMEMGFKKRPDWWGLAETIRFKEWMYTSFRPDERIEPEPPAVKIEEDPPVRGPAANPNPAETGAGAPPADAPPINGEDGDLSTGTPPAGPSQTTGDGPWGE